MATDPFRYFRLEARELVEGLGQGALALEKGEGSAATVAHLLRLAHTLKGAARVVRQREIADLSHDLEDALLPFKDAPTQARPVDVEAEGARGAVGRGRGRILEPAGGVSG